MSADLAGRLVITWPKNSAPSYHQVILTDLDTGTQITSALDLTLTLNHEQQIVIAELTMLTDLDGNLLLGTDHDRTVRCEPNIVDGDVVTGTFRWLVVEMRTVDE